MDIDERWVKWYKTVPGDQSLRDRHWGTGTSLDCAKGCAFCVSTHESQQYVTLIDDEVFKQTEDPADYRSYQVFDDNEMSTQREYSQFDGHYLDWGGQDGYEAHVDWECNGQHGNSNEDDFGNNCRDRKTLTHWQNGRWWGWRTSMWKRTGYSSITYNVNFFYNYGMVGVFRGDYIRYYNHMHSGSVGDEHPDGWNWHASDGGFHNYSPYGANFYHDSGDIGAYNTGDQLRIDMDLRNGGRTITMWLNSEGRGWDWRQVCRWTDMDIGNKGIAFGGTWHDGADSGIGDSLTIMDIYWSPDLSYDDAIASGEDLAGSPGSGVDEGDRDGRRLGQAGDGLKDVEESRRRRLASIRAGTAKRLF